MMKDFNYLSPMWENDKKYDYIHTSDTESLIARNT